MPRAAFTDAFRALPAGCAGFVLYGVGTDTAGLVILVLALGLGAKVVVQAVAVGIESTAVTRSERPRSC